MRFTANSIPHGTAFFFVDLRKDLAGSRWLLSKIAGGPHAATSIWNGINRLGLVAPWCDPGPRHQIVLFLRGIETCAAACVIRRR